MTLEERQAGFLGHLLVFFDEVHNVFAFIKAKGPRLLTAERSSHAPHNVGGNHAHLFLLGLHLTEHLGDLFMGLHGQEAEAKKVAGLNSISGRHLWPQCIQVTS